MRLLKSQMGTITVNIDTITTIYVKPEGTPTQNDAQHSQKYVLCCELIGDTQPVYLLTSDYNAVIYYQRKLELTLINNTIAIIDLDDI